MSAGDLGVIVRWDGDFTTDGYTDDEELNRLTVSKLGTGEWGVYMVGAVRECDAGDWHPVPGCGVFGIVTEATTLDGAVVTRLDEIGDEHLRETAQDVLQWARDYLSQHGPGSL